MGLITEAQTDALTHNTYGQRKFSNSISISSANKVYQEPNPLMCPDELLSVVNVIGIH